MKEKQFSRIPRILQYSPIDCRSPYTENRKSSIQPPSPARAHLRSTPELITKETSRPSFERQTPCDRSFKFSEVTTGAFRLSLHVNQSVTPQSWPWDEKKGSRYTRSQKKKVLPGSATSSVGTPKSSTKKSNHCSKPMGPVPTYRKERLRKVPKTLWNMFFELGRHQQVTRTSAVQRIALVTGLIVASRMRLVQSAAAI